METFDSPNVNLGKRSEQENWQNLRAFLTEQTDKLNYYVTHIESQDKEIAELKAQIKKLESEVK